MQSFLQEAFAIKDEVIAHRRFLHHTAEVGDDLPITTKFIMEKLSQWGYDPKEIVASGVVATVGGKRGGKTILLRADTDALPYAEKSGLSFAATNGNCHGCGHDMHPAMLLGAAKILKEHEDELEGTVKLMFQPNEEGSGGAEPMIRAGLLENPKVDAAIAIHVSAGVAPAGQLRYRKGTLWASADQFRITIKGSSGHGAAPSFAKDPINAAAHVYTALQAIQAREVLYTDSIVLTIGSFHRGDAPNSVPDEAVLEGTFRTFSVENREMMRKRITEIATSVASAMRCSAEVSMFAGYPPTVNDGDFTEEVIQYMRPCAPECVEMAAQPGGEDFAYVAQQVPSTYIMLGAGGEDPMYQGPGGTQHNSAVIFNEDVLPYGVAYYCAGAVEWLKAHKNDK